MAFGGRAFVFGHQGHQPPVRDLLQRWRRCLASLLFFTVLLTEHAGGALAAEDLGGGPPAPRVASPRPEAISAVAAAAVQQVAHPVTSTSAPTANPPAPTPPPDPPPPNVLPYPPPPPSSPPPSGAHGPPPPELSDVDNRTCAGVARDVWMPPPSEAVVDYECPSACADDASDGSVNQTTNQCLYYLDETQGEEACKRGEGHLKALHLKHCCESSVWSAMSPMARKGGVAVCTESVRRILEADDLARRITCEFDNILDRYDCGQVYSVRFSCDDCKAAYRRWVCSSLLPFYAEPSAHPTPKSPSPKPSSTSGAIPTPREQPSPPQQDHYHAQEELLQPHPADGERVWPCRGVCHSVEQRCPFVLPGDRLPGHPTQYAGEPSFICLDPNIPEIEVQLENSAYGDHLRCCYTHCPSPAQGTPQSFESSPFLLPAGDREVTNNGKGLCFHCLRGRDKPRSITPGGRGAAGIWTTADGLEVPEGTVVEPAPSGSKSSLRHTRETHCWRLLVLQGLLLCLARRISSHFLL